VAGDDGERDRGGGLHALGGARERPQYNAKTEQAADLVQRAWPTSLCKGSDARWDGAGEVQI
jgi:hypothetical protein